MAITQIKGSRQIASGSIDLTRLEDNFLQGKTWVLSSDDSAFITGLADPVEASGAATKAYVDGLVNTAIKSPDAFETNASGDYPSNYKGTGQVENGDSFYVTSIANGTTVGSRTVNVGDLLVALVNNPGNDDANWTIMESNRDQATETVKGVARLATQLETNAGTNDTTIVTPLKLQGKIDDAGLTKIIAGNGLVQNTVNRVTTIDVQSGNTGIGINADSILLNIGTNLGTSLTLTSTGVELADTITGSRTFSMGTGDTVTFTADVNNIKLTNTPDGTDNSAITNVDYVNNLVAKETAEIYGEAPEVTDGSADVTLLETPRPNTERVYLNGVRMNRGTGNDYTISDKTITFANPLVLGDVVVVDYKYVI